MSSGGMPEAVLPRLARALDDFISRGEGLDSHGDPYGPPLPPDEVQRLLARVREARFPSSGPPFLSPLAPPGGATRIPLVRRPPRRGGRWALLALPYGSFSVTNRLGIYELHARALQAEGFGVACMPLPYHGSRVLGGQPSGWGFVRADLGVTTRAMAAAAAEVMALARHLRDVEGAKEVVGLGISLGGEAIGLATALGAPIHGLGLLAAVDNPVSFYATGRNREARRRTLTAHGVSLFDVEQAFQPIAPGSYPPPLPPARLHFAIPEQDAVVPAVAQEAWRRKWDGTPLHLPWHGHASALLSPGVASALARRLAGADA